jgi:alkylation response protein AidB-like acyl-CoA dehydrogenase
MTEPAATDPAEVREQLRRWIDAAWDPELGLVEWRALGGGGARARAGVVGRPRPPDGGWACPTWPREWFGRSLPAALAEVVADALADAGVPGPPDGVGMHLAAPTLLEHGSDDLKRRLLRPTVTGEVMWCQLFSEPGAGSDLAGLTTRAERRGDEWIVSGQKLWSTGAAHADLGLLLARTDWDVPKHRGITYLVLPMRQPGVEVRPLRQMNGHASFNEVFLDAARVPAGNVIGQVDGGWKVALATLAHERRLAPARRLASRGRMVGRAWREAIAERVAASEPHKWYPQRAGRPDLVIGRAVATGRARDPVVRQEIVKLIALAWSAKWTAERAAVARALGRPPGPEGSLGKLASSNIARAAARVHALIADASGMLAGADSPLDGTIAEIFLSVPSVSIAGGTDEIQRNILAERILGLPKEPETDRDAPFRSVRRNG